MAQERRKKCKISPAAPTQCRRQRDQPPALRRPFPLRPHRFSQHITVKMSLPNVSADLIWEITRNNNSYLVKRNTGDGVQLSRDPLNLANKNSRKHAGYVNEKAVGISADGDKGVHVVSKTKASRQPAKNAHKRTFGSHNRKYVYEPGGPKALSPDLVSARETTQLTQYSPTQDLQEHCLFHRQVRIPPRPPRGRHCPCLRHPPIPAPREARAREEAAWQRRQEGCSGVNSF
ncbi:hypothetical protein FJTKL_06018 [Diaporthe vaccinii]|uniref:Ribosomal eL28/Mak16 domain-containing protein n=1 Tax=Diaporthe vaccinii TaxID=105482 RepID=A0ABR4DR49_9PEZI